MAYAPFMDGHVPILPEILNGFGVPPIVVETTIGESIMEYPSGRQVKEAWLEICIKNSDLSRDGEYSSISKLDQTNIFKPPSGNLYNLTSCSQRNKNRLERPNICKMISSSAGPTTPTVWEFFEVLPQDTSRAKCLLCGKIYSRGNAKTGAKNFSTCNLRLNERATFV
uniref:BED-type domain-containing protein n=1 Tax=Romanomermis culicivorax TaxID=13658 RepID=A0A915JQJ3_ROMCU